jgi:tRNA(Arg) A34 adenosine deaminase TadA
MDPTQHDEKFVSVAAHEARKSNVRARIGCVAVSSGKVVAKGFNSYRTYSKDGMINKTCSCHAEIDVLRKCLKRNFKKKMSLYIVRVTNEDMLACSAPCLPCTEKMREFNIKSLTYIDGEGAVIKEHFRDYMTSYQTSGYMAILKKRVKCL